MDILLIAGLWLERDVWDDVVSELGRLGHRAQPVALPGVDDGSSTATLEDQVAAVLAMVDSMTRPVVVGHSAGCTLAWMAADRRREAVDKVLLIGGFPATDGSAYADFLPTVDGVMPFPGWEPFEGADSEDLAPEQREAIAAGAVPVPVGVSKGIVRYTDERRSEVPIVMVCPEFSPEQAKAWIAGGDIPELSNAQAVSYVDIDSGHWPMVTKPEELARLIADAADPT